MDAWLTSWYATRCLHAQRGLFGFTQPRESCPIVEANLVDKYPNFWIFCCKYVAQLSVGLACVVWTINGKTFNSYGDFYARVIHGRSRVPTRQPQFFAQKLCVYNFSAYNPSSVLSNVLIYFSFTMILVQYCGYSVCLNPNLPIHLLYEPFPISVL